MCACILANSSPSAFAEAAMSDVHECLVCIQSPLAVEQMLLSCKVDVSHDLVVILSIY